MVPRAADGEPGQAMSVRFWETLGAAVAFVLLFDVLGARLARRFGFPYAMMAIPSWIVFLLMGLFVQGELFDIRATVIVAAVAALAEATLGNRIVAWIGPPRPAMTTTQLLVGSALGVVSQVAIAFVGATWLFYGVLVYAGHHG
jgi:hypothetical protein